MILLVCRRCGTAGAVEDKPVGGQPVAAWWVSVGRLCKQCRQQVTAASPPPVHAHGHDTEHEAADSVAAVTGALRRQVMALLVSHEDGLTDDEGGVLMGGDRLDFGRRRQELYRRGLVADSGVRRLTPRGRKAIVWILAENAENANSTFGVGASSSELT